ncbi:MAG TPA: hypothetical protein VGK10_02855 [Prolixibacteraceae bacterium]|jgi:hypothetical protein
MKRSYSITGLIGALALGTIAGAAIGVSFFLNKKNKTPKEIAGEAKDLAKNLRKKAQKKAKNIDKEEWLAQEKDKIMAHAK